MVKKRKPAQAEKLTKAIIRGMQEKKATEIVLMDLREARNAVADFFVICSGSSDKQLSAIADSVTEETLKEFGEEPWHLEGRQNKEWMLLDYITVVVHIFKKEKRNFYALEKLWGDAELKNID
jgi:ribosome-associated protein